MLLFISSLDITDDDISILKPVHELTKKENQYKIVWVPIVEQWTDELRKKFDVLKNKMPWYTVQYSGTIAGLKFIKEEWNFKGKPQLVVMNAQGKVEHSNAFHMIRLWGVKAFPFTETTEKELSKTREWLSSVVVGTHPSVPTLVRIFSHRSELFKLTRYTIIDKPYILNMETISCGKNFSEQ